MKRIEIDVSRTDFEVKKGKEFKLSLKIAPERIIKL